MMEWNRETHLQLAGEDLSAPALTNADWLVGLHLFFLTLPIMWIQNKVWILEAKHFTRRVCIIMHQQFKSSGVEPLLAYPAVVDGNKEQPSPQSSKLHLSCRSITTAEGNNTRNILDYIIFSLADTFVWRHETYTEDNLGFCVFLKGSLIQKNTMETGRDFTELYNQQFYV